MSTASTDSLNVSLDDGHLLCVRPPRSEHHRDITLSYQGGEIDTNEAMSELLHILQPNDCAPDLLRQRLFLKYAMHQMQTAITLHDEVISIRCETDDELMLSSSVSLAKLPVPQEYKDWIGKHLREILKVTRMEDLTNADRLGLSGFTLRSLQEFRCHIQRLSQEEMGLLMDVTWFWSTPRLAWELDLNWVGQRNIDKEE